jgi:hypothetical protein
MCTTSIHTNTHTHTHMTPRMCSLPCTRATDASVHTHTHTHTHTKDATDVFAAFHAGATTQYLKEFEIGEVDYYGTKDKELVFFFGIFCFFLNSFTHYL